MELQSFPSQDNHNKEALEQIYEIQREIEGLKLENDILRNYKSRANAPVCLDRRDLPVEGKQVWYRKFCILLLPPRLRVNGGNCLWSWW